MGNFQGISIAGILSFLSFCAFSQEPGKERESHVDQTKRFEVEINIFDKPFDLINGEENGLLMVRPTDERNKEGNLKFELIGLDTALEVRWEIDYFINRFWQYRGYDYEDGAFYLLFKYERHGSKNLKILKLNLENGDTTHFTIKNLVPIQLTEFEMTPKAALLGGYFNSNPLVIYYNLETQKSKVLPGIYENRTELIQLKVEEEKETFIVIVSEKTFDRRNTLGIKTYDFEGNLLSNTKLDPEFDRSLVFGRAAEFDYDGSLIAGTYSGKRSSYSQGLFVATIDPQEKQKVNYYNYADLENFFSYMKAKRQKRIANKIERKKVKGKKIKFNYRLLVHDIIENNGQYIMLGEAFYPKYNNTASYAGISAYSSPGNYGSYFAGYRYTHAIVIGFNNKGKILWDNSFQIEDVLSLSLDQYVHADVREDDIVLFYMYDNEIRTKIIKGNEVVEGKSFDNIKLSFQDDVLKNSYSNMGGLELWYGNTFYAYGTQNIKNLRDQGVKLNRRVFFINKIEYK